MSARRCAMAAKRKPPTGRKAAAKFEPAAKRKPVAKGRPAAKRRAAGDGKADLNRVWRDLVRKGYEIDVGAKWRPLVDRGEIRLRPAPDSPRVDLPYGSTERPGYELLQRPEQSMILKRGTSRAGSAVAATSQSLRYEPVPIETVLWDGQGTDLTREADQALSRRWNRGDFPKRRRAAKAPTRLKRGRRR